MSSPHHAFEEAHERIEHLHSAGGKRDRILPVIAAVLAVLTALASLFSHHKSISALALKTEATLKQSQSGDQYAYYESKRIKYHIYSALADTSEVPQKRDALKRTANREMRAALPVLTDAQRLSHDSEAASTESETVLGAYETLELAATLFEISIVFVSISALAQARWLLWVGCALSAVGALFFAAGLLQH